MPKFELECEFEVYCACGEGLCRNSTEGKTGGRGMPYITVEPCSKCLDKAKDDGYSDGYSKAEEELANG